MPVKVNWCVSRSVMNDANTGQHPFARLDPSFILDAVESAGYQTDGRVTALNSYENRVYQIGIEDSAPLIAKFYRPQRWSDAQIIEEHQFAQQCDSCKAAGRGCAFSVAEVACLDSLRAAPPELWTHDKVDRRKAIPKSSFVCSSKVAVIQV